MEREKGQKKDGDREVQVLAGHSSAPPSWILKEWSRSNRHAPRACQRIGTETKPVIHGQVLEAIAESNIVIVWVGTNTIDVDN